MQGAIAEVGGVQALVDLIIKWSKSTGSESVLVCCNASINIFIIREILFHNGSTHDLLNYAKVVLFVHA